MRVYIAGPINGYQDGNRAAFSRAAAELTALGYEPVNPHDVEAIPHDFTQCRGDAVTHSEHRYGCFMLPDLMALLRCDGYALLDRWWKSRGARVEQQVADICGLEYVRLPGGPSMETVRTYWTLRS